MFLKSKWHWALVIFAVLVVWWVIHMNCTGCQARAALWRAKLKGEFPLPNGDENNAETNG